MTIESLLERLARADREYRSAIKEVQEKGGKFVYDARMALGMTQRELAIATEVHHTYISKIEGGHVPPGTPFLRKLARLVSERMKD